MRDTESLIWKKIGFKSKKNKGGGKSPESPSPSVLAPNPPTPHSDAFVALLKESLERLGVIFGGDTLRFVVAYSGGKDSSALLHALAQLRNFVSTPMEITAAYFDHGWRGSPPAEIQRIQKNCEKDKISLIWIPPDRTQPHNETTARYERYRELTRLAKDMSATALLTAHHADDQLETILFRLCRGTGIEGLSGIRPKLVLSEPDGFPAPILRPFLAAHRADIDAYIERHEVRYFDDPTNMDTRYRRNAIRKDVLPLLKQHFPDVEGALLRVRELSIGDAQIVEDVMRPLWRRLITESIPHWSTGDQTKILTLDLRGFNQLSLPYQRRLMKKFLQTHGLESGYNAVQAAINFMGGEDRDDLETGLLSVGHNPETQLPIYLSTYRGQLQVVSTRFESHAAPVPLVAEVELPPDDDYGDVLRSSPPSSSSLEDAAEVDGDDEDDVDEWVDDEEDDLDESAEESDDDDAEVEPETDASETESAEPAVADVVADLDSDSESEQETVLDSSPASSPEPEVEREPRRVKIHVPSGAPFYPYTLDRNDEFQVTFKAFGSHDRWMTLTAESLGDEELLQIGDDFPDPTAPQVLVDLSILLELSEDETVGLVRTRMAGDRFQPLGMEQPMRLKRFFINKGIPRLERDNIPVLVWGDHILWIPGLAISELCRIEVLPTHRLTLRPATENERDYAEMFGQSGVIQNMKDDMVVGVLS